MPAGSILVADDDTAIRTVLNQALSRAGSDGVTVFAMVEQQLGLKLEQGNAPTPVFVVDGVNAVVRRALAPDCSVRSEASTDVRTSWRSGGLSI